jgi:hypothetical protein
MPNNFLAPVRPLAPDERRRCAKVARRLIEEEKARRYALCQLYDERDAEHERRQTALIEAIEECSAWIARFRSAANGAQFTLPIDADGTPDRRAA